MEVGQQKRKIRSKGGNVMKIEINKNRAALAVMIATVFLVAVGGGKAATITYVGYQADIEAIVDDGAVGWRNTNPAKPLDIDGDDILGTDGYRVGDGSYLALFDPPYASTAAVAPNRNNFGALDNPADPSGTDTIKICFHDASAGVGVTTAALLQFVISAGGGDALVGKTLRVGVLYDTVGGPNTATYTVTQTVGGSATATSAVLPWEGVTHDVVFFDIEGVADGDTFVVKSTVINGDNWPGPFEQVAGITFDSAVAGISLSNDSVSSNAVPGTVVGTFNYADADEYVVTGGADSGDFLVTRTNELRTAAWVDQASYDIEVTAYSNSTSLVTTSFTIDATSYTRLPFEVTAQMKVDPSAEEQVGVLSTEPGFAEGTVFTIESGRDDLFTITGNTNLVQVAGSDTDAVGGVHYIEVKARNAGLDLDSYLVIEATVISGVPQSSTFRFR